MLQISSPAASSPSEGGALRPQEGKSSSASGTKKSFASTLRTAQQREDKGRLQRSDDTEPRQTAKADTETDQVKGGGEDAPRSSESKGRGPEAKPDRSSQSHTSESAADERKEAQANVSDASVEVLGLLNQIVLAESTPEQRTDVPQVANKDEFLASPDTNGMTEAPELPLLLSSETEQPATVLATMSQTSAPPLGGTVSGEKQSQSASAAQPILKTREVPSGHPLDPMAEPVVKAADHESGEQGETPAQGNQHEKQAAPVQPATERGTQVSSVSQELSRLDADGPQLARFVAPPAQQKQVDSADHPHHALHSPTHSPDAGGEERAGKSMAIAPHAVQAGLDAGQSSNLFWSNQDERQSGSGENPWVPPAPLDSSQSDVADNHPSQPLTASHAASSQPRSVDSRPTTPAGAASTVSSAHDIEPFIPTMSRSVVFEIAEPDLGRINIRVAMANELVHAYLSSDRSEVGQFLINGQDRLQSALQSNGLEMGQFRVDIDRQNAGRSFQQGSPQDQSRMWQQASSGSQHDSGFFERHEASSLFHAGRLNIVA